MRRQATDTAAENESTEQPVQTLPGAASDDQLIAMLVDRPQPQGLARSNRALGADAPACAGLSCP